MTPERLAEIRDRVIYNPEDWPITIELVAHIDTITAENDRLKGEVERLKRLNTSLVYGHDIFKLAALRVESTLRTRLDALVQAAEAFILAVDAHRDALDNLEMEESDDHAIKEIAANGVLLDSKRALSAAVAEAKGEK